MTNNTDGENTSRPYPPPNSVIALLARLRSRNLPERVDAEYLRDAGITDSLNSRTLFALRFLGLVDGDVPSPTLRSISRSTDEEYRTILTGILHQAYREVFEVVDPTQDSQERIVNVFRRYTPGSQRDRMVVFFLGMCREAGIPTLDAPRNRASSVPTPANTKKTKPTPRSANTDKGRVSPPSPRSDAGGTSTHSLAPALQLLVASLPPAGTYMPKEKQEQWVTLARATLAYVYPSVETKVSMDGDEEDETDS